LEKGNWLRVDAGGEFSASVADRPRESRNDHLRLINLGFIIATVLILMTIALPAVGKRCDNIAD
jgi:hypothetical protein